MSTNRKMNIFTHERAGRVLVGLSVLTSVGLSLLSPWFLLAAAGTALNFAISGITDRCLVKSLLIRMGFPGERDVGRAEGIMSGGSAPAPDRAVRLPRPDQRHRVAVN